VNNGQGLILSGLASENLSNSDACPNIIWVGSGSGVFTNSTLPALYNFTVSQTGNTVLEGWTLAFAFNEGGNAGLKKAALPGQLAAFHKNFRSRHSAGISGVLCEAGSQDPTRETVCGCDGPNCGGQFIKNDLLVNVPQGETFSNYTVGIFVGATATGSGYAVHRRVRRDRLFIVGFGAIALGRVFV
jgi:hypothetical protein